MKFKVIKLGIRKKVIEEEINEEYKNGWEIVSFDWGGGIGIFKNIREEKEESSEEESSEE